MNMLKWLYPRNKAFSSRISCFLIKHRIYFPNTIQYNSPYEHGFHIEWSYLLVTFWGNMNVIRIPGTAQTPGTSAWFMIWITSRRIKFFLLGFTLEFGWPQKR